MRFVVLLGTLLFVVPATASAQRPAGLMPHPSPLFAVRLDRRAAPFNSDATDGTRIDPIPPTHWQEGAIVGGVVVGLLGASIAGGLCGMSEVSDTNCTGSTIAGFFVGALVGGSVGALIGGQFPK